MIRYLAPGVVGAILAVGVSVAAQDLPRAECVCDVPEGYVLASPSSPASLPVLVPVITPVVSFDEHLTPSPKWPYEGRYIQLRDLHRGQVSSTYPQLRIIANTPKLFWRGRIHNQLVYDDGRLIEPPPLLDPEQVWIEHVGYDPEVYRERGKAERAFRLLKREMEEGRADDPMINYYYARELHSSQRYAEAVTAFEKAIPLLKGDPQAYPQTLAAYRLLIDSLAMVRRPIDGWVQEALRAWRVNADLLYAIACAYATARQFLLADRYFEQASRALDHGDPTGPQDLIHRKWQLWANWSFVLAEWAAQEDSYELMAKGQALLEQAAAANPELAAELDLTLVKQGLTTGS